MKNEPVVMNEARSDTPLMVFREILKLAFDQLFILSEKEKIVPRDALSLVTITNGESLSTFMSQRATSIITTELLGAANLNIALQDLTTLVLFQLVSIPYGETNMTFMDVIRNFCDIFVAKDSDRLSLLTTDNQLHLGYWRERDTLVKFLSANPWLFVLWVLRLDGQHYESYTASQ